MDGTAAEGPVTKTNVGRLTNAIFAFTFLLLFRNIRTPAFGDFMAKASAHQFGLNQLPDILNFLNVFLILAMVWVIAFHVFHQIEHLDYSLLYLHLVLLMLVIFIPITSNLATVFAGNAAVSLLFHLNMLAIGVIIALEWGHCQKKTGLLREGVPVTGTPCIRTGMLYIPLTAVAGCVMANFDLPYTQYIYFVTMIAFAVTGLRFNGRGRKNPEAEP
jgi:uncharacterized membrane protein